MPAKKQKIHTHTPLDFLQENFHLQKNLKLLNPLNKKINLTFRNRRLSSYSAADMPIIMIIGNSLNKLKLDC